MCGIVGIYSREGHPPHRELWPALINHLAHRGPDEGGWWAADQFFLGHRRLAILDISSGQQPMATPDGQLVVIFNGEIYNYVELRAELESKGYRFLTRSDTEVILYGYREWGKQLPYHLAGMFAFALADCIRGELFLARDRFGEKPLFIVRMGKYVAFASELRPLSALPDLGLELNEEALGEYLVLNYVPGVATLLRGVDRLPPGSWLLISPRGEERSNYWSLPDTPSNSAARSLEDALAEWQPRFDRAVRFCLRSDVPVGIFLSGGIDSSLIAESAMRQGRLNRAYCLDFEEESYSEYPAAKFVASRLGLELERVVLTTDVLRDFPLLVEHADDPLADSSSVAVWTLARHTAACGNKVVLGGDGGDELFAGYLTYRATQLHSRFICRLPPAVRSLLHAIGEQIPTGEGKVTFSYKLRRFLRASKLPPEQAHFSWNGTWLPEDAARLLHPGRTRTAASDALATIARRGGLDRDFSLFALQRCDLREYLVNDILVKTDRQCMAHGLETRAPFLEHELAAWSLLRPDAEKISQGGKLKALLRAAARRTLGPEIGDRPKQGFSIPVHKWIRGPLAETFRDLLSAPSISRLGCLDPRSVKSAVEDHFSGRRSYGFELWGLAVLVQWYRIRIQHRPDSPLNLPLSERIIPRRAL